MITNVFECEKCNKIFIKRTKAAMDRIEDDNKDWLSVDEFLKELETW